MRAGTGGTFVQDDITLVAGSGITLSQSGNQTTISMDRPYLPVSGGTINDTLTINGNVYGEAYFYK